MSSSFYTQGVHTFGNKASPVFPERAKEWYRQVPGRTAGERARWVGAIYAGGGLKMSHPDGWSCGMPHGKGVCKCLLGKNLNEE